MRLKTSIFTGPLSEAHVRVIPNRVLTCPADLEPVALDYDGKFQPIDSISYDKSLGGFAERPVDYTSARPAKG